MLWLNKHARFRDHLSPYIDGRLTPDEARGLETHLDGCEACRGELGELRATASALRDLPQADAPRSFALTPEMLERRAPAAAPSAPPLTAGMRLASAAVALVLTIVVIGDLGGISGNGDGEDEAGIESRTAEELQAGAAEDAAAGESAPDAPAVTEQYDLDAGTDDRAAPSTPVLPGENAFASCPDTGVTGTTAGSGQAGGGVGGPASAATPTPEVAPASVPATPAPTVEAESDILCAERAGAAQPTVAPGVIEALRDAEDEAAAAEADSASADGDGISALLVLEIALAIALVALLTGTIVEFTLRRRSRT